MADYESIPEYGGIVDDFAHLITDRFDLLISGDQADNATDFLAKVKEIAVELAKKYFNVDDAMLEPILTLAAKSAYDKYIKPIDLPYIPNFVEPLVDAFFRDQGVPLMVTLGIKAVRG